ncbi:MAG: alkaline phosphatase PhoX, partial [Myxococcota bacterium]
AARSQLVADPAELFDLAAGLSYAVVDREGAVMSDGYLVPGAPDGMGCFAGPSSDQVVLLRNHELGGFWDPGGGPLAEGQSPPPEAYDREASGGVTRVVFDLKRRAVVSSNLVLTGTMRNCAGGVGFGGWLTCEEDTSDHHGYVFACAPETDRVARPQKLAHYGRFRHEAAVVDPVTQIAYLTEDQGDSAFYRFLPDQPSSPHRGRLQALSIQGEKPGFDTSPLLRSDARMAVHWVDIARPDSPRDDVRHQAQEAGAAVFRRGEGIVRASDTGTIFFTATTGGPVGKGQVFVFEPSASSLRVWAASSDPAELHMPDNITTAPWGGLVVCEDGAGPYNYLRSLSADGRVVDLGCNVNSGGEITGACFDPSGRVLFASLQREGITLAITGDWRRALQG